MTSRMVLWIFLVLTAFYAANGLSAQLDEKTPGEDRLYFLSNPVNAQENSEEVRWRRNVDLESTVTDSGKASSKETKGEIMETAEQVIFRPLFRYKQIVEERRKRNELKRQKQMEKQDTRRIHTQQGQVYGHSSGTGYYKCQYCQPVSEHGYYTKQNIDRLFQTIPTRRY